MQCDHVNRVSVHASVKIGGASLGQCEREALPGMVVCAWHATPEAITLLLKKVNHTSDRGFFLAGQRNDVTTLTVELYCKWYSLYLVRPAAGVEKVSFTELEGYGGTPYVDHVPNPDAVRWLAEKKGWHLEELAEELIQGRWALEVETKRR